MQLLFSITIALLLITPAQSQSPTISNAFMPEVQRSHGSQDRIEKALKLLDQVADEAEGLRLTDNRVLVLVRAADLYWPYDRARAQALFRKAMNTVTSSMSVVDGNAQPQRWERFEQLQEEIINAAARHDVQFALEMLGLSDQHPTLSSLRGQHLQLAETLIVEAAASEPRRAVSLAEENLASGKYEQLPKLIAGLQASDNEAAAMLARKLLVKLRAQNPYAADVGAVQAVYGLLRLVSHAGSNTAKPSSLLLDHQSVRALAEMAVAFASSSNNPDLLLELKLTMEAVEKIAPALAPQLRLKLKELIQTYGEPSASDYLSDEEPNGNITDVLDHSGSNIQRVEELIKLARTRAVGGEREAAFKLLEEAQQHVGDRVKNLAQLNALLKIAFAYANVEPSRSFQLIESIAEQLDSLTEAGILVGGFFTDNFERDGELLLHPFNETATKILGEDPGGLSALARADFERLIESADRFQRLETRIFARLLLVQSVLLEQPSKLTKP